MFIFEKNMICKRMGMFVFVKSVVWYKGWNKNKKGGFQTRLHTMFEVMRNRHISWQAVKTYTVIDVLQAKSTQVLHVTYVEGSSGVRGIFFLGGGQSHFSWFFPHREILFPGRNFHFCRPLTNFNGFKKWKAKKEKRKEKKKGKKINNIPSFLFHFPSLPCLSFLVEQQKFSSEKHQGVLCPLPPRLLRHWKEGFVVLGVVVNRHSSAWSGWKSQLEFKYFQ